MTRTPASADLAQQVCLALVVEGIDHGWAVGSVLAPDGGLGRIWTLSRPLVYRALDQLVGDGRVRRRGTAPGRGRNRILLAATAAGRRDDRQWLDRPVVHLRDVRIDLLVKLELRRRRGMGSEEFLDRQIGSLAPLIAVMSGRDGDIVDRWRAEQARAVERFLLVARAEAAGRS